MKQHITAEQLNELSEKGKEKLWSWWSDGRLNPKDMEMWNLHRYWDKNVVRAYLPLLSIGQMIEFLDDNDYPIALTLSVGKGKTLCDTLWEAAKEVIK